MRAVYAFLGYSVDRETAEDLASTTFERVVKAWHRFDPELASERTWVLAIARNALTDHFRRQRHRVTVSMDEHPTIVDTLVAADDPLARQLTTEGLVAWLGQLGERERTVLALRYGADLPAAEIAETLNLTEGNVHQIISRSLRRLREAATPPIESD